MINNKNPTVTELGTHTSKVSSKKNITEIRYLLRKMSVKVFMKKNIRVKVSMKKNITELRYLFLNAIFQLCQKNTLFPDTCL
jgi:hypothetical protein